MGHFFDIPRGYFEKRLRRVEDHVNFLYGKIFHAQNVLTFPFHCKTPGTETWRQMHASDAF